MRFLNRGDARVLDRNAAESEVEWDWAGVGAEAEADASASAESGFLRKFGLYMTALRFYMVGRDKSRRLWRVLTIDGSEGLHISEDPTTYSEIECYDLLKRVHDENKSSGGLKFVTKCYGIVGFVKFLGPYYMLLITRRRKIGTICGHAVYSISKSETIALPHSTVGSSMASSKDENRYKRLLCMVDLTKDFFFSYSYNIMRSLQKNACDGETGQALYETMFVWNEFLTRGIRNQLKNAIWTVALVYGFFIQDDTVSYHPVRYEQDYPDFPMDGSPFHPVPIRIDVLIRMLGCRRDGLVPIYGMVSHPRIPWDVTFGSESFCECIAQFLYILEAKLSISGKDFKFTLIARRSRHFAGTRYLKRGVDEKGRVANDVETEQIVFEDVSGEVPIQVTSVVQNRGSIPLFWSQKASGLNIKPDIILQKKDQNYEASRLHFENLVKRYGNPIIILNLIKTCEKKPRESLLRAEFVDAIDCINKDLSEENLLRFLHWDLQKHFRRKDDAGDGPCNIYDSRAGVVKSGNGSSEDKENSSISGSESPADNSEGDGSTPSKAPTFQRGVLRTNCIDCLDRTNIAQYAYGLAALGRQLHALGFIDVLGIDQDAPLAADLMVFYESMGDALSLQYGGSAAHNKRTLLHAFNGLLGRGRKIRRFLGHFQPQQGKPALWELLHSNQHSNIGRHVDENARPVIKKSISALPSRMDLQGDDEGLCESNMSYSRCTSAMSRSQLLADSEHGNFTEHRFNESSCSNFLDLDWEEEVSERSSLINSPAENLSTENVMNGVNTETTSEEGSSLINSPAENLSTENVMNGVNTETTRGLINSSSFLANVGLLLKSVGKHYLHIPKHLTDLTLPWPATTIDG
ncbi:hypothetical protein COCNU_13G002060 [Cocos nucifera]|uniref:SAC domain-containing protein n=1 Tax=Cocos nucifera TaxID=13894 RepID=A0A8K0ISR0_COCNU|nr:hypothetical protein COCNU_13G002060 [Cocos nucifera]